MLDKKDKEILKLLQYDCTLSVQKLADAVGLTPTPCWKRIKRLEDKAVISGRVALLNKDKLNLLLSAFVMVKTQNHSHEWHDFFVSHVRHMPEVITFCRTTGEYDYLIHVVVRDIKDYDFFYKKLVGSVGEIRDITSCFSMEEIKNTTQLPLV
ncbi:Lrp/AsnC family transcriptional regulator [Escherichia coli]|uniref:Lrp/AsnC family transcriptional regulator n=1 Tax=Escherichia coli TaxID=562 RepID=UPI0008FD3D2E|nr:Lrp/AsnC family transcriptional regulator [Escherichia coli]EAA6862007.1 Lrp/AsnC family transcriptional regulator [Salmonella enterica subsp. enterica serovar Johannesburg]ECR4856851.1 Lrp/AsnC family transcriptional regulator [Salmonella enterica]EER5239159.1 Lrp/AsnC family transcriptional regulator [Escherichia coli]EGK7640588.1 Lrp/AsnC family transcriptional regulator [Salmonella enterica]EGN6472421.1 Lrp/AsnC family transcriptional regulator [Salmonella enterica]